ncbi:DUF4440 domain-containing protein [Ensifer sp. NM-2]|uniref:nuclear transport factor 2 family protein n=1 Tax=Ensifer sp. NM-2 TaxID=2109730 RepID=UPI000D12E97C|nr:nuclear transport factor 2 family protein [Ensifer sp. NM-2]PSS60589.1 DUF4440 domain-containing protein [Ensifer sp. NM-2]
MSDKEEIRTVEARRYAAMLAGDVRELAEVLDDDLTYIHSDGSSDSRDSYLAKVTAGHFVYRQIEAPVERVNAFDDTAIITGRMLAEVVVAGETRRLANASLAVYRRRGAVWRLVAFQPTPLITR